MAYADQTACEIAAGGAQHLIDLCDHDADGALDPAVLAAAQAEADGWIDSYLQRMHTVPLETVPDVVQRLAASETVYRLKVYRRTATEDDARLHEERRSWLLDAQTGKAIPGADPYPVGDGGGAPIVEIRSDCDFDYTRGNSRGFW